ncbi:MAG: translation initiation factor IF-2 [Desulfomonilaceae bacterium]
MTMLTVDDLARDLKVRNEDLLRELLTMGYEVEGPESPLETDDPAALRAQLVTALPHLEVVEKRIKPTVIRRRVKKDLEAVGKEEVPAESLAEAEAEPAAEGQEKGSPEAKSEAEAKDLHKKPLKKAKKPEAARIIEMAPRPVALRKPEGGPVPPSEEPPAAVTLEFEATKEAARIDIEPLPGPAGAEAAAREAHEEALTAPEAHLPDEERLAADEKTAKKKKKKEKKMQPAQIIGKVELRKEPPREPERVEIVRRPALEPPRPSRVIEPPPRVVVPDLMTEEQKRSKKKEKKVRDIVEERIEEEKGKVRRRKEVLLRGDLYDDRRPGRLRAKGKKPRPRKTEITTPKAIKMRIKLPAVVTVANLAHKMSVKASEVIQHLISLGGAATVNEAIDFDTATIVASEFGYETESAEQSERDLMPTIIKDTEENVVIRPPVITVMGHVDHGKTSLLDAIRSTHVTDQEAGGITQHIGAYKVKAGKGELVFLDTPGHEAFTAMRARGAQVTDFVILVVAADDGVMDQTVEAINHSRAANVPIIVAVNKIDKPDADKDRVIRELSEHNLIPEAWGGDTLFTYVSAKTGEGVDELLDLILLQAEVMELKANPNKLAAGTVIEARLDKGKGPVATVLVKEGTLKLGDPFVAGTHYGKVRALLDHEGRNVDQAGPATPVEVHGLSGIPEAGELFVVVDEEKIARQISLQRQHKQREQEVALTAPASLEDLLARMKEQQIKELNIVIKADVQGSVEAVREALLGIAAQEIKVKVIHGGVGGITESDVMLASASKAIMIGFNVRPSPKAAQLVEDEKIDLRLYSVIYEAIDDVRKAMEGMLAPIERETIVGRAEVRQTFHVPKAGTIAGCYVTSGKIERSSQVRLIRDDIVIHQGRIASMKRQKDDIKESLEGYECGIGLENYNKDVKVGDIIEAFTIEKESAKLT